MNLKSILYIFLSFACFIGAYFFTKNTGLESKPEDYADAVLSSGSAAVGVKAPQGWKTLYKPESYKFCFAFVIKGTNFHSSPSMMYAALIDYELETSIEGNLEELKKIKKDIIFVEKDDYLSKKNIKFVVRHYLEGPKPNNYEAVGYLRHNGKTFLLSYSSIEKEAFSKHIDGFYKALDKVTPYPSSLSNSNSYCLTPGKNNH